MCGINALYEEITLPQTLANQMDVETQTATIEVAADLYSVPDHRVQQFVAQYVPIELKTLYNPRSKRIIFKKIVFENIPGGSIV